MSDPDVESLRSEFRERGFVVLRRFFPPEETARVTRAIEEVEAGQKLKSQLSLGAMRFCRRAVYRSEALQRFASQPRVVNLVSAVAGPDLWVRWDQAVAKGPGADTFPWHQDNGYSRLKAEYFQLWVALTPMSRENGALWVEPRIRRATRPHRRVGNHMASREIPEDPILIEAETGDAVLFSSYLLHCTTPNTSRDERLAYVLEYMRLDDIDPFVGPPFFVVCRGGTPCAEFVRSYPARRQLLAWLQYSGTAARAVQEIPRKLRNRLRGIV